MVCPTGASGTIRMTEANTPQSLPSRPSNPPSDIRQIPSVSEATIDLLTGVGKQVAHWCACPARWSSAESVSALNPGAVGEEARAFSAVCADVGAREGVTSPQFPLRRSAIQPHS